MADAQEALLELARIKDQINELTEQKAAVEADLIVALEKKGQKTISANNGDLTGTLVKGSVITIDEDALKKALGATLWKKVTKQVLDKERLEAHIVTGDVDPNVVASVSAEKDRKPYIRVSGTFRPKKPAAPSGGDTKPAAKKVVRRKKTA